VSVVLSLLVCAVYDFKFEVTRLCFVTIYVWLFCLPVCLCGWSLDCGMFFFFFW